MCYLVVGSRTGYLAHVDTTLFSTPDSHDYRQVADWIYGARPSADASIWRPFFYPLLLGASERLGGATGVWLMNVALWFAALNMLWAAALRLTRSHFAAGIVFAVLATNISLILLTFHALTETLAVALIALWILALERFATSRGSIAMAALLLPLSLLTLVKPEFELLLAVTTILLLVRIFHGAERVLPIAALLVAMVPIAIQVGLMVGVNHYFGISEVGDSTIRGYYLPRLLADLGVTADVYSGRNLTVGMSNPDVLRLLAAHPLQATHTFASILKGNLLTGSSFVSAADNGIWTAVDMTTSKAYAVLGVLAVPLILVAFWRSRDPRLFLLSVGALCVFVTGGLSFWQGDRLTVIVLPLGSIAVALAARHLVDWMRETRATPAQGSSLTTDSGRSA